jgi:hypothetical protein
VPKYRLYYETVASTYVEVEAEDADAAVDKAWDEAEFPQLCAQCSGWGRSYSLDLGEWEPVDGEGGIEEVSA